MASATYFVASHKVQQQSLHSNYTHKWSIHAIHSPHLHTHLCISISPPSQTVRSMPVFGTWRKVADFTCIRVSGARLVGSNWKSSSKRHVAHKHKGRVAEQPDDLKYLTYSIFVYVQRLTQELLTGIDFLHANRIIHRDLKPQNLLLSSQGHLKIADFGLAKTFASEMRLTSLVVTLWYRAPEVLLGQGYNSSVDIWSAACIIFEMYNRKPLFPGTSEKNQLDRIFE